MSCRCNEDESDGAFQCKFLILAPKSEVFNAFIDHIWYKNNPFGMQPDKLIETNKSEEFNIDYPQRSLACKTFLETIYECKQNKVIKYTVESILMPTSKYHSTIEFIDYYHKTEEIQYCILRWSAHFNFRFESCNYCCPFMAVIFRKIMEGFITLMANSLKTHIETKKQK
eukprot:274505_1